MEQHNEALHILNGVEKTLNDIKDVLGQRGLSKQYGMSCQDTLDRLRKQTDDCLATLQESGDNDLISYANELSSLISRLTLSCQNHMPPQEIERRTSEEMTSSSVQVSPRGVSDSSPVFKSDSIVVTTEEFTDSLKCGSTVYSWGRGDLGALLHADCDAHEDLEPVKFSSCRCIMQIASGLYHSAAVTTTGELYVCGCNDDGQISEDPSVAILQKPRLHPYFSSQRICYVSCGAMHTACINAAGIVYSFGSNDSNQCGHSATVVTRVPPRIVEGLHGKIIRSVACGDFYTLFLTYYGEVYSCGCSEITGHADKRPSPHAERIESLVGVCVSQMAAGANHAIAITSTGGAYVWGDGSKGQLGMGTREHVQVPTPLITPHTFTAASAGESHSIFVTPTGQILGAGNNKCGQLGLLKCHTTVLEKLEISHFVSQAVCGRNHTLVLCHNHNNNTTYVISFGDNKFNQCGLPSTTMQCRSPTYLEPFRDQNIVSIFAGGDQSFAIQVNENSQLLMRQFSTAYANVTAPLTVQSCLAHIEAASANMDISHVITNVMPVFASPALLAGSFIHPTMPLSLDVIGLETCYKSLLLLNNSEVISRLVVALVGLLTDVEKAVNGNNLGVIRTMLIVWQCPLLAQTHLDLMCKLCGMLRQLSDYNKKLLSDIIHTYPSHIYATRIVSPIHIHLTSQLKQHCGKGTLLPCMIMVLNWLYDANLKFKVVPDEIFYNEGVNSIIPFDCLMTDYINYNYKNEQKEKKFYLSHYPFLYNIETKQKLVLAEAALQQHEAQAQSVALGMVLGVGIMPFLVLQVDRKILLQSTLQQIAMCSSAELKKPLKVVFIGEEGIDEGGVKKEFFQLLTSQLFDVQYGMFTSINNGRALWFNKDCTWSTEEYNLVGVLLGLAMYNGVILDLHLPHVLYKLLRHEVVTIEDVEDFDVELYDGLTKLLNYEPAEDVEMVYCRTFDVTWESLGMTYHYELMPNGASIALTGDNRKLYVEKYVQWLLVESVAQQFCDFKDGFLRVVTEASLKLFRADELEKLIAGTKELDFVELEKSTTYVSDNPMWSAAHPTIMNFWSVVHNFDFDQKQRFLMFVTGSMKAPVGGLKNVRLVIQRMGPHSDSLPTAHTCFNTLLLPEYDTKLHLQDRLLKAINECEGFGLK